ncbi:MAG: DUF2199 domain-containing protein [Cyclobacteriaceae bacterium]
MNFSLKKNFRNSKEFKEAGNTTVYATIHVMKEGSAITLVSHELDGDWQFMGDEALQDFKKVGMLVTLDEVIKTDRSVLELADLPIGYRAVRKKKKDKWEIEKIDYSESEIEEMGYYCSDCGKYHREIPMNYGAQAPTAYFNLANKDVAELTQDVCIIEEKRFFIKGQIKIKVENRDEPFSWNVWVEIDKKDFEEEQEYWNEENRFLRKPYSGILDTPLNCYPNTLGLKVKVQTAKIGLIPSVTVDETNHPLFFEQENGIDMSRVIMFAKKILYGHE